MVNKTMKLKEWALLFVIVYLGFFLRSYQVNMNPPGLYIDEISIGNNAYDILTTGKDEYGKQYPLVFKSFGDYKMPLYIYAASVSMAVFGKNEFAVRFTAILSGTLSIIVLYFLLKELFFLDKEKYSNLYSEYIPYLASFILAISSWHLHFSRGGFEVTLAVFLFLLASWLITLFWKTQEATFLWGSYLCYVLTMYSYHAYRIIAPLAILALSIVIYKKFARQRRNLLLSVIIAVLIAFPLISSPHGLERFAITSSFVAYEANSLQEKIKIYPMVYLKNYLSFFSLDYLFTFGDGNGRHQLPGVGLLYRWQLPFLIIGIVFILKKKKSLLKNVILCLLFISPIAASIARPSPHSLRDLLMVFPLTILIAFGILYVVDKLKKFRKFVFCTILIIAILEFSLYIHHYYIHYPKVNIYDWGEGYKEIVHEALKYKGKYEILLIDDKFNKLDLYFNFYTDKITPHVINSSWKMPKDWNEKKIMLIRKFYEVNNSDRIIHNVYLPNASKDIVAQFWDVK